eukprot:TRINITY_DN614_c0_g1_i1.p1 TRINITY_DN614_c0_g1~~TRINITY_DN614_c0_g1_i1.p1  ORF type:complete len:419 (-),score=115.07 TRINITY_DN614_c0_g1_i1:388-1644(-)
MQRLNRFQSQFAASAKTSLCTEECSKCCKHKLGFSTRALHAEGHEKPYNSHNMPICQTSTFYFDSVEQGSDAFAGKNTSMIYTRLGNPTVQAFERVLASLENGKHSVAFGSGMAAVSAAFLAFCQKGDHVIIGDTLYGPSTHVVENILTKYGITHSIVNTADVNAVANAFKSNTKVLYLETPANPTCKITDIAVMRKIAPENVVIIVDATFASPYNMRPLDLGADVSLHSLTKYINGHGDVVGGILTVKEEKIYKLIRKYRQDMGGILSPFDAWLCLRGVRTLKQRMQVHNANAMAVAKFLKKHPKVKTVMFPGLEDFPGHEIAKRQMVGGYGSTFSFETYTFEDAKKLMKKLHICTLAVSLGNVDTLIEHPGSMTHASVPRELMAQQGLTPELVRISVGMEEVKDIIGDLKQALDSL